MRFAAPNGFLLNPNHDDVNGDGGGIPPLGPGNYEILEPGRLHKKASIFLFEELQILGFFPFEMIADPLPLSDRAPNGVTIDLLH